MKDMLKKYWFLGLVGLGLLVYLVVYAVQTYQSRPIYVETKEVDGKSVVYSLNGENYFADDFYNDISDYANSAAFAKWKSFIVNAAVEDTSDLTTYATNYASYVQQNNDESTIVTALQQAGFANGLDDLYNYCLEQLKADKLYAEFYENNYDKYVPNVISSKAPKKIYQILIQVADVTTSTDENGNEVYTANMTDEEQALYDFVVEELKTKDFETVAKEYYEKLGSESDGYVNLLTSESASSTFVAPFAEACNALNYGEVSDVVASEYGYHVIYVTEPTKEELLENDQFMSEVSSFYSYANVVALNEKAKELGIEIIDADVQKVLDEYLSYAEDEMAQYEPVSESEVSE